MLESTGTTHDVLHPVCDCVTTCHAGYAFNNNQNCHILDVSVLNLTNTIDVAHPVASSISPSSDAATSVSSSGHVSVSTKQENDDDTSGLQVPAW